MGIEPTSEAWEAYILPSAPADVLNQPGSIHSECKQSD